MRDQGFVASGSPLPTTRLLTESEIRRAEAQKIRALLVKANSYREALELLDMHIKSL